MAHKPFIFSVDRISKIRTHLVLEGLVIWGILGRGGSENVWHASLPTKFFVEGPLFIEVMGVFFFQLYIMLHVHVYRNSFTETEF